jgi:hypothetical protein
MITLNNSFTYISIHGIGCEHNYVHNPVNYIYYFIAATIFNFLSSLGYFISFL